VESIARVPPNRRADGLFFQIMTLLMAIVVVWGFAPSYFLRGLVPMIGHSYLDNPPQPIRWLYLVHGAIFTTWMALSVVQVVLIAVRRVDLHRQLGRAALLLAPVMLGLGLAASVYATRHGFHDIPVPSASFLTIPLFDLLLFAILVAIGLIQRRQPQTHKRCMLLAMMAVAEAGWARIPPLNPAGLPLWMGTELILLVPLVLWDLRRLRRLHPATLWGGLAFIATNSLRYGIGASPLWLSMLRPITG
jgi:hypothetical protein